MVTLAEVKTYLGITGSTDDTLLTQLINLTTGEIEGLADRNLIEAEYTDEVLRYETSNFDAQSYIAFDLNSSYLYLFLKNRPVSDIEVSVDGVALVQNTDYRLIADAGVIEMYTAPSEYNGNITATYTAGWAVASVPQDLKSVALGMVKGKYQESGDAVRGQGGVQSTKVGDYSVTYGSTALPSSYTTIINKYKNIGL